MKVNNLSILLLVIVVLVCTCFFNYELTRCLLYKNDTFTLGIVSIALILVITISSFRLTVNLFDLSFLLLIIYKACRITASFEFSNTTIFTYLLLILTYLSGKVIFRERTQQISSLCLLAILGGVVAFTGLLNVYENIHGPETIFIHGTFPTQGQYAGMVALLFPFPFFALKYSTSRLQTIVLWICALLLIGISSLVLCRSLWASILIIAWLHIAGSKRHRNEFYWLSIVGMIAIAVIFFRINEASALGRINIWKISLQLFADHPLFGIGTGKFAEVYPDYQAASYANGGNRQNLYNAAIRFDPYNEYLRGLVEGGIVYLIGIMSIAVSFFVLYKRQDNRYVTSPFLFSLISLGIYSLFYYPFDSIVTVILSTLICSVLSCSFNNDLFQFNNRKSQSLLKMLFICLLSGIIYISFENYRKVIAWNNAQLNTNSNPARSLSTFAILNKSFSNNADFWMDYGNCLLLNGQTEKALQVIKKAIKLKPSTQNLICIGTIYQQENHHEQAIQAYRKAADLTPYLFRPKEKLFDLYTHQGDSVNASNIAKEIIELPVKIQNRTVDKIKLKATDYLNNMNNCN